MNSSALHLMRSMSNVHCPNVRFINGRPSNLFLDKMEGDIFIFLAKNVLFLIVVSLSIICLFIRKRE